MIGTWIDSGTWRCLCPRECTRGRDLFRCYHCKALQPPLGTRPPAPDVRSTASGWWPCGCGATRPPEQLRCERCGEDGPGARPPAPDVRERIERLFTARYDSLGGLDTEQRGESLWAAWIYGDDAHGIDWCVEATGPTEAAALDALAAELWRRCRERRDALDAVLEGGR